MATQGSGGLEVSSDFAFAIYQEMKRMADVIKHLEEKDVQRDREMLDLNERLQEQRQLTEEAERKVEDFQEEFLQKNAEYEAQ